MNLDNIYAPKEGSSFIPAPLSLKRNGFGSELNYERDDGILGQGSSFCPDSDLSGKYFAASIRKGPFMTKQEDRVSIISNYFSCYFFSIRSKKTSKAVPSTLSIRFLTVMLAIKLLISVNRTSKRSLR